MPTEKPKVTAYVDEPTFAMLKLYAGNAGISISQATAQILENYFFLPDDQVEHSVEHSVEHQPKQPVDTLSKTEIEQAITLGFAELSQQWNEVISDLQNQIESLKRTRRKPPAVKAESDSPKSKPLSLQGADLARRLGVNPGTLIKNRTKANFSEWSKGLDPQNLSWVYSDRRKIYQAVP